MVLNQNLSMEINSTDPVLDDKYQEFVNVVVVGVAAAISMFNFVLFTYAAVMMGLSGIRGTTLLRGNISLSASVIALTTSLKFMERGEIGAGVSTCPIISFVTNWFWNVFALSIISLCHERMLQLECRKFKLSIPIMILGIWKLGAVGAIFEFWLTGYNIQTRTCVLVLLWDSKLLSILYEISRFFALHFCLAIYIAEEFYNAAINAKFVGNSKKEERWTVYIKLNALRFILVSFIGFLLLWIPLGSANFATRVLMIWGHSIKKTNVPYRTYCGVALINWLFSYLTLLLTPVVFCMLEPNYAKINSTSSQVITPAPCCATLQTNAHSTTLQRSFSDQTRQIPIMSPAFQISTTSKCLKWSKRRTCDDFVELIEEFPLLPRSSTLPFESDFKDYCNKMPEPEDLKPGVQLSTPFGVIQVIPPTPPQDMFWLLIKEQQNFNQNISK